MFGYANDETKELMPSPIMYAHKLTNTGQGPLKYLAISSKSETEVCEYPDSGKFLVSSKRSKGVDGRFRFIGRAEQSCDYWEGEDSAS